MDSFEITPGDYDLSELRMSDDKIKRNTTTGSRPTISYSAGSPVSLQEHTPAAEPAGRNYAGTAAEEAPKEQTEPTRRRASTPRTSGSGSESDTPDADTIDLDKHKTVVTLSRFFADGRLRIFFGVVLILLAGYMLVASISYHSTGAADQSLVQNSTAGEIAAHP